MFEMFEIRYYNDCTHCYVVINTAATIAEAGPLRQVSGDLVVDVVTDIVVADPIWLWPWEQSNGAAYAYQQLGRHLPGRKIST
jgi:hypothetical protein